MSLSLLLRVDNGDDMSVEPPAQVRTAGGRRWWQEAGWSRGSAQSFASIMPACQLPRQAPTDLEFERSK
jgi:hypothetical protein